MPQEDTQSNVNSKLYGETIDKASPTAAKMARKSQETISELSSEAKSMSSNVIEKTDQALSSVGEKMTSLAGSIRSHAPTQGTFASAADTVAEGLESSGKYLSEHGVKDLTNDTTGLVRKYPIYSLGIGVGVGMLLGAAWCRR